METSLVVISPILSHLRVTETLLYTLVHFGAD